MPRFARVVIPSCPHHVTQRGNERRDVFFTTSDRHVYLGLLKQYSLLYSVDVLGYCLMTNHVHLGLIPARADSLSKFMREVQMRYSQYHHALERGNGHLWQSRYLFVRRRPSETRFRDALCGTESRSRRDRGSSRRLRMEQCAGTSRRARSLESARP